MRTERPSICLSMIVRDEVDVVGATLDCVAPHIDHWVIVDTGSTDATRDLIRSRFDALGIPGEMHERPWRDFGTNRTEALALCRGKAEYAWVIDADDLVVGSLDLSELTADSYLLRYGSDFRYWRTQIFRTELDWRYVGRVHEYATCGGPFTESRLEGDYHVVSRRLGARNRDPDKYERDRRVLLAALADDPDNPRTVFYLAQSCFDAGHPREALGWYSRRAEMGGFAEEVFYSLLRRAQCLAALGEPLEQVVEGYLDCWRARPWRAEPLYEIARLERVDGDPERAYDFARRARAIPFPDEEILFVDRAAYLWRGTDELADCAYRTGRLAESRELWNGLLESGELPESERLRVRRNVEFIRLRESVSPAAG